MIALELGIALGLVLFLLGAVEIAFRIGRRRASATEPGRVGPETGAIQGAMLGLLGLLLGFSFSGATSRHLERQELILEEANALSTAHLRAGLLSVLP